jgi:isopenicillin-N epimerase
MGSRDYRRRELLTGVALAAAAVAGCSSAPGGSAPSGASVPPGPVPPAPSGSPVVLDEWERIRGEFSLSREWVHLGGFLLASHPRVVREAIEAHRRELDENPVHYLAKNEKLNTAMERVVGVAGSYMGVTSSDVALTDSTTMSLATLYQGLALRAGDEILTTTHDHFSTHESLRLVAQRTGATVRKVALYERPSEAASGAMVDAIARAITRSTRVVAITWVHSSTGVKLPVRAIADAVAKANTGRAEADRALLCVDGVHGFGVEDVTMADLGCDFFAAGCHKWLFGPRGTGVLWGKTEQWARLRPTIPHFGAEAYSAWMRGVAPPDTNASMMTPGGFHSFEHRWALGEAFSFHLEIGKAKVAARIHELSKQFKEGLAAMPNITLHTPRARDLSSGIVCFDLNGRPPDHVVEKLFEKKIIATTTPYRPSCARVAPGLLNSPAEVDSALREIRALG